MFRASFLLFFFYSSSGVVNFTFLTYKYLPNTIGEDTKIVGGERAPNHFPYQISLQVKMPLYIAFLPLFREGWGHNCGGSIITEKHVLTAAHCLDGYKSKDLSILAGTEKLNDGGQRYKVDDFLINPNYKELNTSDIGIITIKETFMYNDKVM